MTRNKQLRAVLLAALMVLWVFAGAVAFTGSVAAQDPTGVNSGATVDDIDAGNSSAEQTISGINVSTGQAGGYTNNTLKVYVNLTNLTDANADLDSAQVNDFSVTSSNTSNASAGSTSVSSNSGVTVAILTLDDTKGDNNITLDFDVGQIDTTDADLVTRSYDVAATNGSTSNSSYDASNGNAPKSGSDPNVAETGTFSINSGTYDSAGDTDTAWVSGDAVYQGQRVDFRAVDNPNNNQYRLRSYDSTAQNPVGGIIREPTFTRLGDNEWQWRIKTGSLEGQYVITKNGSTSSETVATDSNGVEDRGNYGGTGNEVSIIVQDLDANFSEEEVSKTEKAYLELDSARSGYTVEITSDELEPGDLSAVFEDASSSDETDDGIELSGIQSTENLTLDFGESGGDVDPGEYSFDVDVDDTSASASESINVTEAVDADADFDEAQFDIARGDVANITLTVSETTDRVNITVGTEDDGYETYFEAEPNSDDQIHIQMNTYLAGGWSGASASEVYSAEEGSIATTPTRVTSATPRVLASGQYDISVTDVPDNNEEPTELDLASLNVVQRSTDSSTVHTAPTGRYSDLDDLEGILEQTSEGRVTESDTIATKESDASRTRGDVMVIEVVASGVFGAIDANERFDDDFGLEVVQNNNNANRQPKTLNLSDTSQSRTIVDAENQTIYYVVKSDSANFDQGGTTGVKAEHGDQFDANFTVSTAYKRNFTSDTLESPDDDETVTDTLEIVDREASFDTTNDMVLVNPAPDQEITGETTVAPGTEVRVRARGDEQGFLKTGTTEVAEDGTFSAVFDGDDSFEDVEINRNFTTTIPQQSFEDDAETDGRVVEGEFASVSISDITATQGDEVSTITVDSANLPRGGFVTIHDGSLNDGATFDSVRGTSDYLEGENSDIEVSLDDPYTEDGEVIPMAHQDTNGNEEYDFVSSEGDEDGPYTDADGNAVIASASITFESPETETPTPTETMSDETATATDTDGEGADDQAGFGAVVALIALLGAALLAARRNAF